MGTLGGRLSSLKVARAREPGMLADGDGLYLQVTRANARSWIFRYFRNGKSHELFVWACHFVKFRHERRRMCVARETRAK